MTAEDISKQYLNSQVDLNTVKMAEAQGDVSSVKMVNTTEEEAKKEYEKFKNKLSQFKDIHNFDEAKELAKTMFNIKDQITCLKVGDARCAIICSGRFLRIILDSAKEQICYCFNVSNQKKDDKE